MIASIRQSKGRATAVAPSRIRVRYGPNDLLRGFAMPSVERPDIRQASKSFHGRKANAMKTIKTKYKARQNREDGVKKYAIAQEFRAGVAACLSSYPIKEDASQEWKDGYQFAYTTLRPQINDAVQDYVVSRGHEPFNMVEVMRGASDVIISDDASVWRPGKSK